MTSTDYRDHAIVRHSFVRLPEVASRSKANKGSTKYLLLENSLKKTIEDFLKFLFLFESLSFRLVLENNFIHMAASAGYAIAYMIGPIFKHIVDCVQLYSNSDFTNIVL